MQNIIGRLLICLLFTFSTQAKDAKTIHADSLQSFLNTTITEYRIPGIAVAFFQSDTILNIATAGVRKLGASPTLKKSDKLHLGSCSKAITGHLAGIVVESGKIRWDSRVVDVFPELETEINTHYKNVTLQQLLNHTARVQPFTEDVEWELLERFTENDPVKRRYNFSKWVMQMDTVIMDSNALKQGYVYSNAGYAVATSMLEKTTGKPWSTMLKDEIFQPLGIDGLIGWPAQADDSQPWGHWSGEADSSKMLRPHPPEHFSIDPILGPSGDVSLSLQDYVVYIQKHLSGLNGNDKQFPAAFYEFLHYSSMETTSYSIGWGAAKRFNDTLSTHTGSAGTFHCYIILFKEMDLAVAIISNSADESAEKAVRPIRNYFLQSYLKK